MRTAPLKGGDGPLSCPVPVDVRQRQAAFGAAARGESAPAGDAVAVSIVALVHLALGDPVAHGALVVGQVGRHPVRPCF